MLILSKVNTNGELQSWWNGQTMRINPIREYFICRKIMILKKEYPVLVQFYETHSGGLNTYHAPMLSSAMGDVMYFVSNGYIVFMPDVHFTIGTPGQSCYDAVVSGTKYLIEQGIAHPGKIGLQGHSAGRDSKPVIW